MALSRLPDTDSDGTISCGPGWLAGAFDPDGGSGIIEVSDETRILAQGAGPLYFAFGDLKATPGGPITVDPPGTTILIDFSA
jgi:hypothetical protein